MSAPDNLSTLARAIDDALAALPGVVAVYSPDAAVARAARELAAARGDAPARTRVSTDDEQIVVSAAIGVDAALAAPGTARAAAAAIRDIAGAGSRVSVSIRRVSAVPDSLTPLS